MKIGSIWMIVGGMWGWYGCIRVKVKFSGVTRLALELFSMSVNDCSAMSTALVPIVDQYTWNHDFDVLVYLGEEKAAHTAMCKKCSDEACEVIGFCPYD